MSMPPPPKIDVPEVPSPCINICKLNPQQVCIGCGRSIEEIAEWPSASTRRKQEIIKLAYKRTITMTAQK